jgi:hypothetical protein
VREHADTLGERESGRDGDNGQRRQQEERLGRESLEDGRALLLVEAADDGTQDGADEDVDARPEYAGHHVNVRVLLDRRDGVCEADRDECDHHDPGGEGRVRALCHPTDSATDRHPRRPGTGAL